MNPIFTLGAQLHQSLGRRFHGITKQGDASDNDFLAKSDMPREQSCKFG